MALPWLVGVRMVPSRYGKYRYCSFQVCALRWECKIVWFSVIFRVGKCGKMEEIILFSTSQASILRKECMPILPLFPDLPGCSVEQVSQTEEAIVIIA